MRMLGVRTRKRRIASFCRRYVNLQIATPPPQRLAKEEEAQIICSLISTPPAPMDRHKIFKSAVASSGTRVNLGLSAKAVTLSDLN